MSSITIGLLLAVDLAANGGWLELCFCSQFWNAVLWEHVVEKDDFVFPKGEQFRREQRIVFRLQHRIVVFSWTESTQLDNSVFIPIRDVSR
jgi:hypothetical protein